ncbi:MAG: carboxymuconolactone decarboxylase [Actinomycetia bacterium]|nr:carboxymuconolactone decarboxylase [Actinomycetes bacterium]
MDDASSGDRPRLEKLAGSGPLATHPALARYVQCFLDTFLVEGRLDPRLRELTILRIAWLCEQPFEWASHVRVAQRVGVLDDDIVAVRSGPDDPRFGAAERALLTAADEVVALGRITESTYEQCRLALDGADDVTMELLHLVAGYRMMAVILSTTQPSLDAAGLTLWPPDGIGPSGPSA